MNPEGVDAQADDAHRRLPAGVAKSIAVAVVGRSDLEPGDLLLEVGAGTGEIGIELSRLVPRYRGFDKSAIALDQFRQRFGTDVEAVDIIQADAERTWPADTRGVRAAFGSRVFHLLSLDHLIRELLRVSSPRGLTLIIGRVRRSREAVRSRMREQMRSLLAEEGLEGKSGRQTARQLIEQCVSLGATHVAECSVARWAVVQSPLQSIDAWTNKAGLAGIAVSAEVKERVLTRLRAWANGEFGDLAGQLSSDEEYIIEGVRLPPRT